MPTKPVLSAALALSEIIPYAQKGSCSKSMHQLELTPVEQQHYEVLLKNMEEYCTQYTQFEATFKNGK